MYNNYNPYLNNGFNPNFRPVEQQYPQNNINIPPMQQSGLNMPKNGLQGKQVDSVDVVKATDVPFDGSVSYFPLTDGSAIVTKQLQMDGTSKIVVFKPFNEQKSEVKYLTSEDLEKAINGLNLNEIDNIKEEIKEIKKQMKKKGE
ncbi:MAG: hypothetical protein IJZ77_04760 [Bacilli bacterium]|nr:hypothetical protein [Bacilli bacterium]